MTRLPPAFADLQPFVAMWSVATMNGRHRRRLESTAAEREHFHQTMAPRIDAILDYLDQWPLDEIRDENLALLRLVLAATQVGLAVEYQGARESEHARYSRQIEVTREPDAI